jgi:hypothetical protein
MNKKINLLLIHLLGCVAFLALPILFSPDLASDLRFLNIKGFQRDFIFSVFLILFFYLSYFFLIPNLYFQKKYILYFAINIICFFLLFFLIVNLFPQENFFPGQPGPPHDRQPGMHPGPPGPGFLIRELRKFIFQFLIVAVFAFMLRIKDKWKQAERERLNAELSYLKAQINPHFLFNTLNSIYSLAIEKSDYTATAVVKLSEMMRFVTTEANSDFVSLEKELNYVSSYIELQKLRFENTIRLIYTVEGNFIGKKIAPLILIPFVENAFKHGVNPEENSDIHISIEVKDHVLHLIVLNNKVNIRAQNEIRTEQGIENTKNRLQLLYPSKHLLIIENNKNAFSVSLTIDLK